MKRENRKFISSALTFILAAFCGYLLLKSPEVFSQGIKNGLLTVGGILIPSLFPFMVLACFISNSRAGEVFAKLFSPVTRFVFRLPEEASATVFMSFIGGFPVGAKMTDLLLENGKISKSQAARMYLFCINSGPAFTVSAVGTGILHSVRGGVILFCSVTLSSLITGFVSGMLFGEKGEKQEKKQVSSLPLPVFEAVTRATSQATKSMLSVCSYVLVFSAICEGLKYIKISDEVRCLVTCISEVTNGVTLIAGRYPLPVLAAAIGFGGLCVHMQIMSGLLKTKLKLRHFFAVRSINAALSAGICHAVLCVFPVEAQVFGITDKPVVLPYEISLPCCILFIVMSMSLIFDIAPKRKV